MSSQNNFQLRKRSQALQVFILRNKINVLLHTHMPSPCWESRMMTHLASFSLNTQMIKSSAAQACECAGLYIGTPSSWPSLKDVTYILLLGRPHDRGGLKSCSPPAFWSGIMGRGGQGRAAWSVAEMSEDQSVAFQNKLAFPSRTGSSVCLWKGRWKKRSSSWHFGKCAYLFLHLRPTCRPRVSLSVLFLSKRKSRLDCLNAALPTFTSDQPALFDMLLGLHLLLLLLYRIL